MAVDEHVDSDRLSQEYACANTWTEWSVRLANLSIAPRAPTFRASALKLNFVTQPLQFVTHCSTYFACIVFFFLWHCSVRANYKNVSQCSCNDNQVHSPNRCFVDVVEKETIWLVSFYYSFSVELFTVVGLMNVFIWNNKICCYYNRSRS